MGGIGIVDTGVLIVGSIPTNDIGNSSVVGCQVFPFVDTSFQKFF